MTLTKEEILRNLEAAFDICSKENAKVSTVLDIFHRQDIVRAIDGKSDRYSM